MYILKYSLPFSLGILYDETDIRFDNTKTIDLMNSYDIASDPSWPFLLVKWCRKEKRLHCVMVGRKRGREVVKWRISYQILYSGQWPRIDSLCLWGSHWTFQDKEVWSEEVKLTSNATPNAISCRSYSCCQEFVLYPGGISWGYWIRLLNNWSTTGS